ncbi:MAG: flagellar hook-associated protein FlgK [Desulfovibrio sp.]|nr:flagellar hook-associated protein FlgK [Desulfovibrio sp.]
MAGINSILSIAQTGLRASQVAIQVTGNNISNVDTEGYSRQVLLLQEAISISTSAGQLGTGVLADSIVRLFDKFIELQYLDKQSTASSYEAMYETLQSVESLFNEANTSGINSALATFFEDLENLTLNPDDSAVKEVLIDDTQTLLGMISQVDSDMESIQNQMDDAISDAVNSINELAQEIAELNAQINKASADGSSPNALLDLRDTMVRELATLVDIKYNDNGDGNITILTQAGQTIVDGTTAFTFAFEQGRTTKQLTQTSTFVGQAYYDGNDEYEYTLQVVDAGTVGSGATFRVSLDGGKTWLKDENGDDILYAADTETGKVKVGELEIWFGSTSDPAANPENGDLSTGDLFTLVPKTGVYWYSAAGTVVNVTPQTYANGEANTSRITGGTLAGYFTVRDVLVAGYRERLQAFTEELVWQVNRVHSQGAGATFTYNQGTYAVSDPNMALGSNASDLYFADRLQSGVSSMYFYNEATGTLASSASFGYIDFDATASGVQGFDPSVHSLQDVADAINNTFGTYCTAQIINGTLSITADSGYTFAYGEDSAGLYAALGMNTYFTGSTCRDAAVNTVVSNDTDHLNSAHVNGAGEINSGDNTTAKALAALSSTDVSITTYTGGTTSQTLSEYYNTLVGVVGSDTANAEYNYEYQTALAEELAAQQDAVSAVSLDEEMTNLIRFQQSYQAAAKLITVADEMFQTILGMKS